MRWLRGTTQRHCTGCGEQVEVEYERRFDPLTGAESHRNWYWHCPRASVTVSDGRVVSATWRGDVRHDYGTGEPDWHEREREAAEWEAT